MRSLLPPGWKRPRGYSNGVSASGRMVFTAGVVGWDETETFVATDLVGQFRQVLVNTLAILAEDGAGPEHIVRMTWYITSRSEYLDGLAGIGEAYRALIGKHFPAMAVVEVVALMEAAAKVEIETIAVVPA
ncbi:endoribonuclease L-PSP [Sphingomonas hengshuiensis]|uniref:Endoribonuclease L-PSP n=2 Tax=Sphingomonas hengshuiensis TaxID=1609977 RepID=A0A7U5BFJ8_9SPHN|nr:endoribonuclease L-PSP [Sphingomonas hengshuiensis]